MDEIILNMNIKEYLNGETVLMTATIASGGFNTLAVPYGKDYAYERFQVRLKRVDKSGKGELRLDLVLYRGSPNERNQWRDDDHAPWGHRKFTLEEAQEELKKGLPGILMKLLERYQGHQ